MLLLVLAIVITGCGSGSNGGGSTTYLVDVVIKALDSSTGNIVETGSVRTSGGKAGDSSNGITKFRLKGEKSYTFIANAPYYNEAEKKVKVGKENITVTMKISKAKAKITGRVLDETSNGLQANIKIVELDRMIQSDSDGSFTFEKVPVSDKNYTLEITKDGYGSKTKSNLGLVKDEVKNVGDIVLSNTPGTVSGRVKDPGGNAVSDVTVTIVETGKSTTTDANGEFSLESLPGDYTLELSHVEYETYSRQITIQSEEDNFISLELEPKPGQITGIVKDEYDYPVANAQVLITELSETTETLSNGTFNLEVPPGSYRVSINDDQFKEYTKQVTVRSTEETNMGTITLVEKTGMLQGRVIDQDTKEAIANAAVRIKELGDQGKTKTDSSGYFYFNNVRIGTYTLEVNAADYSTEQTANVEVLEQKTTNVDDIELIKNPAAIMGNVREAVNQEALKEVTVTIEELGISTKTDVNGSFKFEGIRSDTYSLTVDYSNYYSKSLTSIYAPANSTNNLGTIELDPKPAKVTGSTEPGAAVTVGVKSVTADGDTGAFTVSNLQPGDYTVNISLTNYYDKNQDITVNPGELKDIGYIELNPKLGKIIGSTNADKVEITSLGLNADITEGVFEFTDMEPDTYKLTFTKPGYFDKQVDVTINPNQTTDIGTVDLEPRLGTIEGYINDTADVILLNQDQVLRDKSGYFEFSNLEPEETYYVKVDWDKHEPKAYAVTLSSGETKDLGNISLDKLPNIDKSFTDNKSKTVLVERTDNNDPTNMSDSKSLTVYNDQTMTMSGYTKKYINTSYSYAYTNVYGPNFSRTDKAGNFSITKSVNPGTYTIKASILDIRLTELSGAKITVYYTRYEQVPLINFSKLWDYGDSDYSVFIEAIERKNSAIKNLRYKWTNSLERPSSGYSSMDNKTYVTVSEPGVWYLHAEADTRLGRTAYNVAGPFVVK